MQQAITYNAADFLNLITSHKIPIVIGLIPLALFLQPKVFRLLGIIKHRPSLIPHTKERVLIIGGTSGIGKSLALQYAQRGASLCIVGRRESLVREVVAECLQRLGQKNVLGVTADFTQVEDMICVRDTIEKGFVVSFTWG